MTMYEENDFQSNGRFKEKQKLLLFTD